MNRRTRRYRRQPHRTIRKHHRGGGPIEHLAHITAIAKTMFPDLFFEIHGDSDATVGVEIYCESSKPEEDTLPTTSICIREDEIFINLLGNCSTPERVIRGTEMLQRIIAIGKGLQSIGIQRIRLKDASRVQFPNISPMRVCMISLAGFLILTSPAHHSWYNSHGFVSGRYKEEVKSNTAFSQEPMLSLLRLVCLHRENKKKNPVRFHSKVHLSKNHRKNLKNVGDVKNEEMDRLAQHMLEIYEGKVSPAQSIQEGILAIHTMAMAATSCKDPKITFYTELMEVALRYGIDYDPHLTLEL